MTTRNPTRTTLMYACLIRAGVPQSEAATLTTGVRVRCWLRRAGVSAYAALPSAHRCVVRAGVSARAGVGLGRCITARTRSMSDGHEHHP